MGRGKITMEEPVEYNAGKKEERILITTRHTNKELNMTFTSMYKEFTRQEAIEKITDALCSLDYNLDSDYAEAALDALLGDDK